MHTVQFKSFVNLEEIIDLAGTWGIVSIVVGKNKIAFEHDFPELIDEFIIANT